jgi:hypothetical protein
MTDETETNEALEQWKAEMQAEHEAAIENPDPDENHRIEGVSQVSHRVYFTYDDESAELERAEVEQVEELADPELLACSCGVRGMTRAEARTHVEAARERE